VVRGDSNDYLHRHPGPAEIGLVVEVSEATLHLDRTVKKRLYAEAGVAVYWLVNLVEKLVEVYGEPSGPTAEPDFRRRESFALTDSVPLLLDSTEVGRIAVKDLLP
jgi:Uma2 family endonuclease